MVRYRVYIRARLLGAQGVPSEERTYSIETSGGPWCASVKAINQAYSEGLEHVDIRAVDEEASQ